MSRNNKQGFTTIELLIAVALVLLIAITLSNFVTSSFQTNALVTEDTDTLVAANKILNGIYEEAKYGIEFNVNDTKDTLTFSTSDHNVIINWDGANINLTCDGVTKTLNTCQDRIENLSFEENNPNVEVILTIAGKTYRTSIYALNYIANN